MGGGVTTFSRMTADFWIKWNIGGLSHHLIPLTTKLMTCLSTKTRIRGNDVTGITRKHKCLAVHQKEVADKLILWFRQTAREWHQ